MVDFPKALEKMPDYDATAVRINGDNEKGIIEFYQKDGTSWLSKGSSFYIGKSSLIGVVYADTLDMYNCNMLNTFSRLNLVTKIYVEKTKKIMQSTASLPCKQSYGNALNHLSIVYEASSDFNKENIDKISDAAKSLADENKNAQLYSCPLIY